MQRVAPLLALMLLAVLACRRPPDQGAAVVAAVAVQDPIVAEVDTLPLRGSQLAERLAFLHGQPEAGVRAAALAASDLLVLREMQNVGALAAATETAAQASDRLLALTFNDEHGCAIGETEIRMKYMENLATYKHPPAWTVWDAAGQCCDKPEGCPIAEVEQCRVAIRQQLSGLATQLRADYQKLPPLGQAAQATAVQLEDTPLKQAYLPLFEQRLADLQERERRLRIVRYTFWQHGLPGFEGAHFRQADPAIETAVQHAKLGEVLGPLDGDDSAHVLVLAARQAGSVGLPHTPTAMTEDPIAQTIRHKLCAEWAQAERTTYRERLLSGAHLVWHREALHGRLDDAAIDKLIKQLASPPAGGVR